MSKKFKWVVLAVLAVTSVAAAGPRRNPEGSEAVNWDSPVTEDLFERACADCHTHQSRWPWYSRFAPVSWLVIHNVNEGREHLNLSTGHLDDLEEAAEKMEEGEMPPWEYRLLHPEARLTDHEKELLASGLERTFGMRMEREEDEAHD